MSPLKFKLLNVLVSLFGQVRHRPHFQHFSKQTTISISNLHVLIPLVMLCHAVPVLVMLRHAVQCFSQLTLYPALPCI